MKKLLFELMVRSILPPFYSFALIESICKKKLQKHPDDPDVLLFLGYFYMWYGKNLEAQIQLENLLKIGKYNRGATHLLSAVYYRLENYNKIVELLTKPDILKETDKENYYLGDSYFQLGEFEQAVKYLKNYVRYDKKNYIPLMRLGYALFMISLYDEALCAYNQAYKLNPSEEGIKRSIDLCIEKIDGLKDFSRN